MKYFIYWTADWKSSKLWSAQLWTQFKQLRIEALKSQDFNGVWTSWTRWLSTWTVDTTAFLTVESVGEKRWKNLHEALGENYEPLRLFAHPLEVLRKALKVLENPLATRWLAVDFYPLNTKPLVYVFAWKVTYTMWALALQMEMGPHKDRGKLWPGWFKF